MKKTVLKSNPPSAVSSAIANLVELLVYPKTQEAAPEPVHRTMGSEGLTVVYRSHKLSR